METSTTNNKISKESIDKLGRSYGTGRRKVATARVWVKKGNGEVLVNGRKIEEYFPRLAHRMTVLQPCVLVKAQDEFNINCTVKGGGSSGQAGAIRHGISRALVGFNSLYKEVLRQHKMLTRDDRMVESKKYGQHGARKKTQFVKR